MLFNVFLTWVLLTITSVASLLKVETKYDKPPMRHNAVAVPNETVFEVMKNISKVNNVLQELIKNYEQLKKIYKTQSFETEHDYSTDSEIDERYKTDKHKKKIRSKPDAIPQAPNVFPGTRPYEDSQAISENDYETSDEAISEGEHSDQNINNNRLTNIESLKASKSPINIKNNEIESPATQTVKRENKITQADITNKPPEIIFIDLHKTATNDSALKPIEPQKSYVTIPKPKTRYKKVDHRGDIRGIQNDVSLLININSLPKNSSMNKKQIYAESLAPVKTWNFGSKNKDVQLEDGTNFRSDAKAERITFKTKIEATKKIKVFESKVTKPDIKNNLNKPRSALVTGDNQQKESDLESAAEEREINRDMFKTKILRQAYGDACLKVVVRKCYKACKTVLKRACGGSSCKTNFKDSFTSNSKTGCIKEFASNSSNTQRAGHTSFPREDFLAAACWPLLKSGKPTIKRRSNTSLSLAAELNILRDRYEKACEKASASKCEVACSYAYKEACKKYDCPARRKKMFRKHCSSQCRDQYRAKDKSSDSSSSGSTSSSSSSSSSDSDNDSLFGTTTTRK